MAKQPKIRNIVDLQDAMLNKLESIGEPNGPTVAEARVYSHLSRTIVASLQVQVAAAQIKHDISFLK